MIDCPFVMLACPQVQTDLFTLPLIWCIPARNSGSEPGWGLRARELSSKLFFPLLLCDKCDVNDLSLVAYDVFRERERATPFLKLLFFAIYEDTHALAC